MSGCKDVSWSIIVLAFVFGVLLREHKRILGTVRSSRTAPNSVTVNVDFADVHKADIAAVNTTDFSNLELQETSEKINVWLSSIVGGDAPRPSTNRCTAWEGKTEYDVRSAKRSVLADHASLFEGLGAQVRVLRLSPGIDARSLPYPSISTLDRYSGRDGFLHTSNFRRFRGVLHKDVRRATFPQWTRPEGPFFVAAIPNAFLSLKDYILICDDDEVGLHLASCLRDGHLLKKKSVASRRLILPAKFPSVRVGIPLCSKGSCRWGGPFHLLIEHLARIAPLLHLLSNRNDTVVVVTGSDRDVEPIVYNFLKLMGVDKHRVHRFEHGVHIEHLLYTPVHCFRPTTFGLHFLRNMVFTVNKIEAQPQDSKLIVFAERIQGSGSNRAPLNYGTIKKLVIEFADHFKFSHRTVSEVTSAETVRQFSAAAVVVGVHGANLAPVVFMSSGAALVEMLARKLHPMCFYHLGSLLGVRYFPVFYDFPHFHDAPPYLSPAFVLSQVSKSLDINDDKILEFLLAKDEGLRVEFVSELRHPSVSSTLVDECFSMIRDLPRVERTSAGNFIVCGEKYLCSTNRWDCTLGAAIRFDFSFSRWDLKGAVLTTSPQNYSLILLI